MKKGKFLNKYSASTSRVNFSKKSINMANNNNLYIYGVHPVNHLIKDTSNTVQCIYIQENTQHKDLLNIEKLAISKNITIQYKGKEYLDSMSEEQNHQGIIALVKEQALYQHIEVLKNKNLIIILDHLEDPQNTGAILRTADQMGVDGVVIPKNRAVGITSAVIKASSGGAFFIPIIQESSLIFVVEKLKEYGFWIYSTAVSEGERLDSVQFAEKTAIIVGNESRGVSDQLVKKSDFIVNIPSNPKKKVDSLNVSVASAILLYSVAQQLGKIR